MVVGAAVAGRTFPEGAALVLEPRGERGFAALAMLEFAPVLGDGFRSC